MIRDLYLRDVPIGELTRVNTILRRTIERDGVLMARKTIFKELQSREFSPAVEHYISDLMDYSR